MSNLCKLQVVRLLISNVVRHRLLRTASSNFECIYNGVRIPCTEQSLNGRKFEIRSSDVCRYAANGLRRIMVDVLQGGMAVNTQQGETCIAHEDFTSLTLVLQHVSTLRNLVPHSQHVPESDPKFQSASSSHSTPSGR